MSDIFVQ